MPLSHLTGVHALRRDEKLLLLSVADGVAELDLLTVRTQHNNERLSQTNPGEAADKGLLNPVQIGCVLQEGLP